MSVRIAEDKFNAPQKREIFQRDKGRCVCCGSEGHHYHHIVPVFNKGETSVNNGALLCEMCHFFAPDLEDYSELYRWEEYKNSGGTRIPLLLGISVQKAEKMGVKLEEAIKMAKSLLKTFYDKNDVELDEYYLSKNGKN